MGPVITPLLMLALLGAPADAEPSDAFPNAFEAVGGFALIDLAVPVAPPLPVFSGELAWHHRLAPWLSIGARYRTHLGAVNRLGPEVEVGVGLPARFAVGATVYTSASLTGSWQDGVDAGGDLASTGLAWLMWSGQPTGTHHTLRLMGGATVEWLLWAQIDGRSESDVAAHPAYAEFVAEWRRFLHGSAWLTLRADVALPLDVDPYAPWGIYPRLTAGGGFGW